MKIHPAVLAAHAQFGGDLESMQKLYEWHDQRAFIESISNPPEPSIQRPIKEAVEP